LERKQLTLLIDGTPAARIFVKDRDDRSIKAHCEPLPGMEPYRHLFLKVVELAAEIEQDIDDYLPANEPLWRQWQDANDELEKLNLAFAEVSDIVHGFEVYGDWTVQIYLSTRKHPDRRVICLEDDISLL
jgi:hypothetical protein